MRRIRTPFRLDCAVLVSLTVTALLVGLATPGLAADDKLEIHGFLTQAWGTADYVTGPLNAIQSSPSGAEELLGIEDDGTFDYRNLALQFRYSITDQDIMIVQLSHEANGLSPIDDQRDEIELDWAFYERRFTTDTRLKVGRIPIPFGIYNEIRDVGTVLPFYRPAFSVYSEGAFTSESLDGVIVSHTFFAESEWNLDLDVYGGEFEAFEVVPPDVVPVKSDVVGFQLWLNTSLSGLRFGYSYQDREESGGFFRFPDQPTDSEAQMASVEAAFDRWSFRGEYRLYQPFIPAGIVAPARLDLDLVSWYVQLGWRVNDLLQFYAQAEQQETEQTSSLFLDGNVKFDNRNDVGASVNISFSPQVILKAEYHWVEEKGAALAPVFTPMGLKFSPTILDADGNYSLVALSVSF